MKLVIVESPYAGEVETNVRYARAAMADCLRRGEAPYASHLLLTQPGILDDTIPDERALGIEAGLTWGKCADLSAIYIDRGVSRGMLQGIERAQKEGRRIEIRTIGVEWSGPARRDVSTQQWFLAQFSDRWPIFISARTWFIARDFARREYGPTLDAVAILPDELVPYIDSQRVAHAEAA